MCIGSGARRSRWRAGGGEGEEEEDRIYLLDYYQQNVFTIHRADAVVAFLDRVVQTCLRPSAPLRKWCCAWRQSAEHKCLQRPSVLKVKMVSMSVSDLFGKWSW